MGNNQDKNKRYAYASDVKAADKFYWKMTEELIESEIKKSEQARQRDPKRRYAFDWYVKDMDKFYSEMAERQLSEEIKKVNHKLKKITALAVTSTVIAGAAVTFLAVSMSLRKSR